MIEDRRRLITTAAAAELAGISRTALFTLAGRAKAGGLELRADRAEWPDGRTPMWNRAALVDYLAGRPGRGANLRRTDPEPEAPAHVPGQLTLPETVHRGER